jgi:hypothetical protein
MEQTQRPDYRKTQEKSTEDLENQYWRDFIFGKSLKKYGVELVSKFEVDHHTAGWLMLDMR